MSDRHDIVVFGATGFTGKLAALYLAKEAPKELRIAIAGRSPEKLAPIQSEIESTTGRKFDVLIASVDDPSSLHRMAASARVIITTVGPYAKYGEPVVRAAVAEGADCVDITGEPSFVAKMIADYHGPAQNRGVRIVNCCGFDSIPHDLGALFTVKQLDREKPISVEAFVQARGDVSGGTWHSAINAFANFREVGKASKAISQRSDRARGMKPKVRFEPLVKGWVAPLPTIDPEMVIRSASAMEEYGPKFRYAHCVRVGSLSTLIGLGAGIGTAALLAQFKPTRELLLRWKDPGDGPSEEKRARNSFRVTFRGVSGDRTVVTRVSGGDPGYTETSKMVSECALALALERDTLPKREGVLTPAMAFGDRLFDRLDRAGIRFETLSS